MPTLEERLWPELEALGEEEVRLRLASNVYIGDERERVEKWLRQKDQSLAEERKEASNREQVNIARSTKNAAWAAAIAAIIAAIAAIIAISLS